MGQRLIKPGRSVATRTPIGRTSRGTEVWFLAGGDRSDPNDPTFTGEDQDDDDADENEDDEEEDDGDDEDDKSKSKSKKSKSKSKKDDDADEDDEDDDEKPEYTRSEYDKLRKRMRASDQNWQRQKAENEALKAENDRLKGRKKTGSTDNDKPPVDDTVEREARERATKAEAKARRLGIENAFHRVNKIDWVDPDDVLRLLDFDEIDVDEDGTVDRRDLTRALKELARRKPHLVKKPAQSGDGDDGEDDDAQSGTRKTAPAMNGKRKGSGKPSDKATLAKRFPSLNKIK